MFKAILMTMILSLPFLSAHAAEPLSADKSAVLAQENKVHLIDIRRPEEWQQSGVAEPAHTISMHQAGFLERLAKLTGGEKDAAIALICATGKRSTWLAAELEKRGFTNVSNVREGMFGSQFGPGWLKRSLPLRMVK